VCWLTAVAQQLREIGIRMALGARRTTVVVASFVDALVLALAGIGLGLLAAVGLTRLGLTTGLFEVSPMRSGDVVRDRGATVLALMHSSPARCRVAQCGRRSGVDPAGRVD
jgi:ABC-type antimicrobial peptide transport system permease subunit